MHVKRKKQRKPAAPAIVIEAYDPAWPEQFHVERRRLEDLLRADTPPIRHIGSTAVPGLPAKAIIDIMLGFQSIRALDQGIARLTKAGYRYRPEYETIIPDSRFLTRSRGEPRCNVHAVIGFGVFWHERLRFRNHLSSHPDTADAYCELKQQLARRYGHDRSAYSEAKTDFIATVLRDCRRDCSRGSKVQFCVNGLTEDPA